jgi:hypothetical protein
MRSHFLLGLCAASSATGLVAHPGQAGSTLALDDASDSAYDDGWQPGDNGGSGFGPWNMDGTYGSPIQHDIDDGTSPYNQLGRAWTMYNPLGPDTMEGTDVARAGRGFAPLTTGQNLRILLDNPVERRFFRGYALHFNSGGGNLCYGGTGCTPGTTPVVQLQLGTFEYFTNGAWYGPTAASTGLFDNDTDGGLRVDVTMIDATHYRLVMTPLANPSSAYTVEAELEVPAERIDWIEFQFYNTDSDFHPLVADPDPTDLYIRSLEITLVPEPGGPLLLAVGAGLLLARHRATARTTRAYG